MLTIEGIKVDSATPAEYLAHEWSLYVVEFEHDCKLLVDYTLNFSVFRGLRKLITGAFGGNMEKLELRRALLSSEYLTVSVLNSLSGREFKELGRDEKRSILIKEKYRLVKEYNSYYPLGYNIITDNTLPRDERKQTTILYNELIKDVDPHSLFVPSEFKVLHRGRPGKIVYKLNPNTGLCLETYASVKDAAAATGAQASNISACCNDKTGEKTAAGFKWSYDKEARYLDFDSNKVYI